jgi:hypothetical protein
MKKTSPEKPKSINLFLNNTAAYLKKGLQFSLTFPIENVPQLWGKNEHLTEVRSMRVTVVSEQLVTKAHAGTKCM